jgi:hypothetical protein
LLIHVYNVYKWFLVYFLKFFKITYESRIVGYAFIDKCLSYKLIIKLEFDSLVICYCYEGDDPRDVKARLKVWAQAVAIASTTKYGS